MIQVFETDRMRETTNQTVKIPPEIVELAPDALAYLVIEPSNASAETQADCEMRLRKVYKVHYQIIFAGQRILDDGRIVYIGMKVPSIVAGMFGSRRIDQQ